MKHLCRILPLALLWMGPLTGAAASGELWRELSPLSRPSIETAKLAIAQLEERAAGQAGVEKIRTTQLAGLIRSVFTSEFQLQRRLQDREAAEQEAKKQEKVARGWMVPNALGSIHPDLAKSAREKARKLRQEATRNLAKAKDELVLHLQDLDSSAKAYADRQEYRTAAILADLVAALHARSLPEGGFTPSLSPEVIAGFREFLSSRAQWIEQAKQAEAEAQFEAAIRLYSRARDWKGRQRCAAQLASLLEEQDWFGSALDYYEMAGNKEKVALLEKLGPHILADKHRNLAPADLEAMVAPGCVQIQCGDKLGSGFFFREGGYLMTCLALLENEAPVTARLGADIKVEARLVARGRRLGLAMLKVDISEHALLPVRESAPLGSNSAVSVFGYPQTGTAEAVMRVGQVFGPIPEQEPPATLPLRVPVDAGYIGGPVVDAQGHLAGILSSLPDTPAQAASALTVETIRRFVAQNLR